MLEFTLYTVHILVCFFLILVVLLQQGKGADLSVFGGGGTMTAFGARGAATLLHKLTVISFILFIITTLTIGVMQSKGSSSSVMSGVPTGGDEVVATTTSGEEDGVAEEAGEADNSAEAAAANSGGAETTASDTAAPQSSGEETGEAGTAENGGESGQS